MGDAITSAVVTSAIARVPVNATGGIPSDKLNEILLNEKHMTKLRPLIAEAVKQASFKQALRDAITELFKNETINNSELSKALTALQNALQSIYEGKEPRAKSEGGARKRKSKKRNYYKKRRATKRR